VIHNCNPHTGVTEVDAEGNPTRLGTEAIFWAAFGQRYNEFLRDSALDFMGYSIPPVSAEVEAIGRANLRALDRKRKDAERKRESRAARGKRKKRHYRHG